MSVMMRMFMALCGVNFTVYYFLINRKPKEAFAIDEVKYYFGTMAVAACLIAINIYRAGVLDSAGMCFHHALFAVTSIMTTTGFGTLDFDKWPEFSRVLLMGLALVGACAGSTGGGFKFSRALIVIRNARNELNFLVHPKAKDVAQQEIFDKIVGDALKTPYTWETQLSAIGQQQFETPEAKKAAIKALWEELLDSGKLGYMALLRNLRNILQADVSAGHVNRLCIRLADPDQVAKSKQLPFRFLSAYREMKGVQSLYTSQVLTALEAAVKASVANMEGFDADTNVLVAADVSGSMQRPVSDRSSVQNFDIGILLSMLLKSKCASVVSGMFGDTWKVVNLPQDSILANTLEMHRREGEVGYSTNGYKVIEWLIANKVRMDKVMIFTDCQMWDSGHRRGWFNYEKAINDYWHKYKAENPEAKLYLFDLAGYGQSPLNLVEPDVYLIAGWSEKVFDVMNAIDRGEDALSEIRKIVL